MPSNVDTELEQLKAIQRKTKQKTRLESQTAKYNKKASGYRGGTGHGVVMYDIETNRQTLNQLDTQLEQARKNNKAAKSDMKEAQRAHVAKRVADGKAHGIIFYDERTGGTKPTGTRTGRARAIDSKRVADVVYPSNPTPEMMRAYLKNPGRADMVGVDCPKGTRPTVTKKTTPAQAKKKAANKRKTTATKTAPRKIEREMIAGERGFVTDSRGRTYHGDTWGDYDNSAMIMASTRSVPRYAGPYARESCAGHRILRVYYDPFIGCFNVLAVKPGIHGTIIGRDYDPATGLWQGGTYDRSPEYITDFVRGMRLVADYGGSASTRSRRC